MSASRKLIRGKKWGAYIGLQVYFELQTTVAELSFFNKKPVMGTLATGLEARE